MIKMDEFENVVGHTPEDLAEAIYHDESEEAK